MAATIDHPLERMVFFSDAVFAIAITLLVIEIHVPHLDHHAPPADYWRALGDLIPNFIGFLISFAVIGLFWAGHHRAFSLSRHFDRAVVPWNLMLLGTIAFMPFVTAFMSAHTGALVPAVVYWSWLVLTALLNLRVNTLAVRPPMLDPEVPADKAANIGRRSRSVLLGAVTALVIAFFYPFYGPAGMATTPLWKLLLDRLERGGRAARAG